jgi:ferric-dicitrate binding protein FerR (iron transport regulator)
MDVDTRLRWMSPSVIELQRGAVYIDTAEGARPLEIRTMYGSAIDIGTQFEVRVQTGALRVRVRSGAVSVKRRRDTFEASAGTELTVTEQGADTRPSSSSGPSWEWTARIAPPLTFEGSTLADYLGSLSREHGWTLEYADATIRVEANRTVLHGSVEGLSAGNAIAVAAGVSGLTHRFDGGRLVIARAGGARGPK